MCTACCCAPDVQSIIERLYDILQCVLLPACLTCVAAMLTLCGCGRPRRTDGILGWYRGMNSKIVQTVSYSALIFLIYESLLRYYLRVKRALLSRST